MSPQHFWNLWWTYSFGLHLCWGHSYIHFSLKPVALLVRWPSHMLHWKSEATSNWVTLKHNSPKWTVVQVHWGWINGRETIHANQVHKRLVYQPEVRSTCYLEALDTTSFIQGPAHLILPKSEEMLKALWELIKFHRLQIEGAPIGQIWDNLNIKINDSNGL